MANLGCFIQDTRIRDDIQEIMGILAAINIEEGEQFTVADAYNHFVRNKIEIDLESVASIYQNTFDLTDANFNSDEEVEFIAGRSFTQTLNNLAKLQAREIHVTTGILSPGKQVAKTMAGIFRDALVTDVKTKSVMKKFEDLLGKAARRVVNRSGLPPARKAVSRNFEEILTDAFEPDETGIRTLSGTLNSSGEVWHEFVTEIEHYKRELEYSDADQFTIDQFDLFSKAIIGKGYDLLISQKESRGVINGALIDAGFYKEIKRNGQPVKILSWKKLTEATGSSAYLQQNVTKVLQAKGYTPEQIARINDALINEYVELRASITLKANNERLRKMALQKAKNTPAPDKKRVITPKDFSDKLARVLVNNPLSESRENAAVRLIREALIAQGFYKDVQVNGKLQRRIDWDKIVKAGIAVSDIKNVFTGALQAQGYSDSQVDAVIKAMSEDFTALVKAQKDVRLARLKKANNPGLKKLAAKVVKTFEQMLDKALLTQTDAPGRAAAAKKIMSDALIAEGYFSERNVNGVMKKYLDWKKVAQDGVGGQEIADMFADSMSRKGYSEFQIQGVIASIQDDLDQMDADIKAKGIKELARRNKAATPTQKTAAKRLAELYTYGLFQATPNTYERVLNSVLGMSDVNQATFNKLKVFGQALQTLYSTRLNDTKLSEAMLGTAVNAINEKMGLLLRNNANSNSGWLKLARTIQSIIDASLRFVLTGLKNMAVQNPLSGKEAKVTAAIHSSFNKETTPELKAANRELVKAVFTDMVYEGGLHYGDLNTTLINRGRLDHLVNNLSSNKMYHLVAGVIIGRVGLDAMDSRFKSSLTQKYLIHNLLQILTSPTNPNRLSQEDAMAEISLALTGTSYAEAETMARNVITKINAQASVQVLNPSPSFVTRLAHDIVKGQLMSGGTMTEEQILAANNAAYRAAGRDLGHVPNNWLSMVISAGGNFIQRQMDEALKNREYNKAAMYTMGQTVFRSFMNPFVGGASNWIVLKFEKSGVGIITGALDWAFKKEFDLSTKAGMQELEKNLYRSQLAANKMYRGATGAAASLILYGVAWAGLKAAFHDDDEEKRRRRFQSWRKDNRWLTKYTDEVTPEWLLASLYMSEGKTAKYVDNYMNWNDQYSSIALFRQAQVLYGKGDVSEAWGKVGEAVGVKANAPIPYRTTRDIVELIQGIRSLIPGSGVPTPHTEFVKPRSFMQGFLERGFLETAHIFKSNPAWAIDALPGVSGATVEQLRKVGITTIEQLKAYQGNLQELHSTDKNGKNVLIFNKNERPLVDKILEGVK